MKLDIRYSDVTDEQIVFLVEMLLDTREVYSQHKFDLGKTRQKSHVTLKRKAELKSQRPRRINFFMERVEKFLTQLKDANIFREMGDDSDMGSLYVNPIIRMPENDFGKLAIGAR